MNEIDQAIAELEAGNRPLSITDLGAVRAQRLGLESIKADRQKLLDVAEANLKSWEALPR